MQDMIPGGTPWRALILDTSDVDDPRWLITTISTPGDVRPAVMDGPRYTDWPQVADWARARVGASVRLVPASAIVWRITEAAPGSNGPT